MNAKDEVTSLIARDGAVLVRSGCHLVYRLSNGQTYVLSATPSDYYAWHNALSNLRCLLGVKREVHKNPNRKRKQGRASTQSDCTFEDVEMRPGWQHQLRTIRTELR